MMDRRQQVKEANNENSVGNALSEFSKKVYETLRANPSMYGSITLTVHCACGEIKRFDLASLENKILQN